MDLFTALNNLIAVYAILLCIIGTIGNIFTINVILRTSLKNTTTFVFFAYLSLSDMISLYFWNLDHFLTPLFQIDRQNQSIFWCKFDSFLQFTVLQSSAFLLVFYFILF